MAEDKTSGFGGFDSLMSNFNNLTQKEDSELGQVDPEEIKRQMESLDDSKSSKTTTKPANIKKSESVEEEEEETEDNESEEEEVEEEDSDDIDGIEPEDIEEDTKKKSKRKTSEVDVEEEELVSAFADLFAEELGWEFNDKDKPKDIKGIVKYMQDIVDTNSKPKYSSDEIKELDEFVANGGKVKDFYKKIYADDIDINSIDLEKEEDQKAIVRKNLLNKGFSEPRIKKLISRYEDNESLEEEAEDSLVEVKEYEENTKKELLESQKKQAEISYKEQLTFVTNVEKLIKDTSDVRGLPLSSKDKQALMEYIFKPEKDGMTKYQKEYQSDLKNLLESAYFTMKRDTFVKQIEKKATTNAVNNLKLKIRSKGKSTKNTESDMETTGGKVTALWDIAKDSFLAKS